MPRTTNARPARIGTIDLDHLEHVLRNVAAEVHPASTPERAVVHLETETAARKIAAQAIVYGWVTLVEIITDETLARTARDRGYSAAVILTA